MKVRSNAETISFEEGILIAFDLEGSEAGYLLISRPSGAGGGEKFFGHDHYVEIQDQLLGRYGGVAALKITGENELAVCLNFDVPEVGNELTIITSEPMSGAVLSNLRQLER